MDQRPHQPEWSRLPRHILFEIARRLNKTAAAAASPVNTLRLRSVCKSWRSAIPAFKQQRETLHFPIDLPFPVTPNPNHDLRGCFSLSQSTVHFLQPPSIPSSLPWLLRVEEKNAEKGKWKALNPLSKVSTESLPRWFPKFRRHKYPESISEVHVKLYKLDETKKEWERVNDQVFFVGDDLR